MLDAEEDIPCLPAGDDAVVIDVAEIRLVTQLGSGNYGTVWKGICRGQTVAVKQLNKKKLDREKLQELQDEIDVMRRLKSNYLVLLMGLCEEEDDISIVMEYVDGRDLKKIIQDKKTVLSVAQKLRLTREIAIGCNWLHRLNNPVVHRDLKPENIMVSPDLRHIKLCDFGFSCVAVLQEETSEFVVGTPIYMAPEAFIGDPATEKTDVYSFGITIWELWDRERDPFQDLETVEALTEAVLDGVRPPIDEKKIPPSIASLIKSCWADDPADRPTFAKMLATFDETIVVPLLTFDPTIQLVWPLLQDTTGYPFEAEWDPLVETLGVALGTSFRPDDKGVQCMKVYLAEARQDLSRGETKYVVSLEALGKFMHLFGPFYSKTISKFEDICFAGWFHGDIDGKTAEERLLPERKGTFLVRLSSNDPDSLVLCKREKKKCTHQRVLIFQKGEDRTFLIKEASATPEGEKAVPATRQFKNLNDLVLGVAVPFKLTVPCPGSIFDIIFETHKTPTIEYVNTQGFYAGIIQPKEVEELTKEIVILDLVPHF